MTQYFGGAYEEMRRSGIDCHHPIAWESLFGLTSMTKKESPVFQMDKEDHSKTLSYKGNGNSDPGYYRQWQSIHALSGDIWTAWNIEKAEVQFRFGSKYDQAMERAEAHLKKLEAEGKLKVDAEKLKLYQERQELFKQKQLSAEKARAARAQKYESEVARERATEQAKAERARILAELKLNNAKLEERHQQIEKQAVEQKLKQAQVEERVKLEKQLETETVKLEKAQSARQLQEARLETALQKEELAKTKAELAQAQKLSEMEQLKAEVAQLKTALAQPQFQSKQHVTQQEHQVSPEAHLLQRLWNVESPLSQAEYKQVATDLINSAPRVSLEVVPITADYTNSKVTVENDHGFKRAFKVETPQEGWSESYKQDKGFLRGLVLKVLLTDEAYQRYCDNWAAKKARHEQELHYQQQRLNRGYGHGLSY